MFWKIIITGLSWLKGKLNNDKEKLCPFLPKSYLFVFSSLLLFPHVKTLVFQCLSINSQVILKNFWPLASKFSILLSNLLKKISILEFYDTETTTARRKQKIRLWLTGNSYSYTNCHSLQTAFTRHSISESCMYSAKVAAQYCSSFPWDLLWRSFWPHFKLRRTLQIDTKAFQAENRSLVLCLLACLCVRWWCTTLLNETSLSKKTHWSKLISKYNTVQGMKSTGFSKWSQNWGPNTL